jgi:transglutaminase-like putative cysteine protease
MNDDLSFEPAGERVAGPEIRAVLMLGLLLVGLASVILGLASAVRDLDPVLLLLIAIAGALLSWVLARSSLPGWAAGALMAVSGPVLVFFRFGGLGAPLFAGFKTWISLLASGWPWIPVEWTPFLETRQQVWGPFITLLGRLADWVAGLAQGGAGFDPVAAALVWSLAVWAVATWAGWATRRRGQVLAALVPPGALLAASLNLAGSGTSTLPVFLGSALLLKVVVDQDNRERGWQAGGVDYFEDVNFDLGMVSTLLVLVLVGAAALAPSLSVKRLAELARQLGQQPAQQASRVGRSLGVEPNPIPSRRSLARYAPGLPRSHLLGAGPELSQQVVMVIQTGDLPPAPPVGVQLPLAPRYYWRGLTYDRYSGRGWATTQPQAVEYPAGFDLAWEGLGSQQLVRQSVQLAGESVPEGNLVFTAGDLIQLNQDYRVEWRTVPNPGTAPALPEERHGDFFGATTASLAYMALAQVPAVSAADLQQAGEDYPQWAADRYRQLPDDLPLRVLALARDLTAIGATPYDRAKAIESHLRSFPYTLDVPAPPRGRDVVDYFLFSLQRGYCDYYATAMVVLARAAGLPARLAIGYAAGRYDLPTASYIVTEDYAHSWPEIYFPGYGWIPFEPTAGQPPLERLETAETTSFPALEPGEASSAVDKDYRQPELRWRNVLGWISYSFIITLALAGLALLADLWRLRLLSPDFAARRVFRRLYRHAKRLALQPSRGATPFEFSAALTSRLASLGSGRRWKQALGPAQEELDQLTGFYNRSLYSAIPLTGLERDRLVGLWSRLRWRLWLASLIR